MDYKLKIKKRKFLADTVTPVGVYLKLRDQYANSLLLESSDYHSQENSYSYICCKPISSFSSSGNQVKIKWPEQQEDVSTEDPLEALKNFSQSFDYDKSSLQHIETGLFGYVAFDGVQRFEDVDFDQEITIPEIYYAVYQFIIVFDHFKNEGYLIEAQIDRAATREFDELYDLIMRQSIPQFSFEKRSDISSDFTDEEFLEVVKKGIHHCDVGDVFQVVFSRKFELDFKGDEFQVYRALRSINPSPYLFYFDYGDFKLFGSSPEAQIVINEKEAIIHPIAGTFKRTGDDQADAELAKKLLEDEKENSEHIMLVDLARNDLSKNTEEVTVETYKEIQYYSHVIHLVSKVTGRLAPDTDALQVMANTFPAGTLSGAPKHRALQLINQYEHSPRGYYGGAIGYIDFKGMMNQAIMIRTFMSQGNKLTFRAGAGIVAKSDPESEVREVYNKVAALQKALKEAENID